MGKQRNLFLRFRSDDQGATAVEYGLIVSLIVVALLAGMNALSDQNKRNYNTISNAMTEAVQN